MASWRLKAPSYSRKEQRCSSVFSALGDPRRLFIVRSIVKHKSMCVSEVAEVARISVAAASQQLAVLEDADVVVGYREGKKVCFEINSGSRLIRSVLKVAI